MDDHKLIREIGKNNDVAFGILIKKYEKLVYNTAYKLLQNSADAEDVSQEVFLKVYTSIDQLKDEKNLCAWLFKISYNSSISFLRKKNPAKPQQKTDSEFNDLAEPLISKFIDQQTPAHTLEQKEAAEELFKAIEKLPDMQKQVFLKHKFENFSHKEICESFNLTSGAVESLIYRAKLNLQKSLIEFFNNNLKNSS